MNDLSKENLVIEENNLVSKYEKKLYKTSLIISIILWIILTIWTIWIGLIYIGIIALFGIIIHIWFISYVKWNWVRVSKNQFPELDNMKKTIAEKMWFDTYTHMYIVNFDWILNAFATKLLSRNFIIITASLLESCDNDTDKLKFIIGHELAHIKRWHVKMQAFLSISKIIPWLGNAYSKACEYTCDNYWAYYGLNWDYKKSAKWLAVLSSGWIYSEKINIDAYLEQAQESNDFWMSLNETKSSHPYLTKRVFNIVKTFKDDSITLPKRNIFGILIAPLTNMWLWIILMYVWIIAWTAAMQNFKNTEDKIKNNLWIEQIENNEFIYSKKLEVIIKKYNEHKNDKNYVLSLYSDWLTYDDEEWNLVSYPLKVTNIQNNIFYFEYEKWEKIIKWEIKKDDKLLWWFDYDVDEEKNEYEYYEEEDSLEELKNIK